MIRAWILFFVFAVTEVALADAGRDCARGGVEAIAACTEALSRFPKNATLYYNRASAYYETGDLDRAIADYTRAIEIDPAYGLAYTHRGDIYQRKDDFDSAIADY